MNKVVDNPTNVTFNEIVGRASGRFAYVLIETNRDRKLVLKRQYVWPMRQLSNFVWHPQ